MPVIWVCRSRTATLMAVETTSPLRVKATKSEHGTVADAVGPQGAVVVPGVCTDCTPFAVAWSV